MLGARGRLTSSVDRRKAIELLKEANTVVASLFIDCRELWISLRSLKRRRCEFKSDGSGDDGRKGSPRQVVHRLSEEERNRIFFTCNEPKYASLLPAQIVSDIADQEIFIGSEPNFYGVLMPMGNCTATVGRGFHRDQGRCLGLGLLAQTRFAVGIFPISPPALKGSGFTSIWWLLSRAERWWLRIWLKGKTLLSLQI